MSWRACSLSHGCQEHIEEDGLKAAGCVLLEASGYCEGPVIGKMAQVGLLVLDQEESFEAALRWG